MTVCTEGDHDAPQGTGDGLTGFAREWALALHGTGLTLLTVGELCSSLRGLAGIVDEALTADATGDAPGDLDAPRKIGSEIGRALVAGNFTHTTALDRTLDLVARHWAPPRARREPLAALLRSVSCRYADELRERVLAEQEQITSAVHEARRTTEMALSQSEARFRALFEDAAVGIGVGDIDGTILEVNKALADMFGGDRASFPGRNVNELMHPEDIPGVWSMYEELIRGEREFFRVEKPYYRNDGHVLWTHLTVSLIRDPDGSPRYQVAMLEDVTERHELHARLRHEATHDPLTGLPNRAMFTERLTRACRSSAERIGVCYLDLDGFKVVNDSLGHHIGDRMLVVIAERLDACVGGAGHLVARMGGDEFVILVEDSKGPGDVIAVGDAALEAVSKPLVIDGRELQVTASVGVIEREVDGVQPSEILQSADITLYRAKAAGRSRWVFGDPESSARQMTRYTLSTRLPSALERGEFFVEYQPIADLRAGRLAGAEALVRWRHPQFGVLGPDAFVGLAEDTGLIVDLGRWVLSESCRKAAAWQQAYPHAQLRVNVNVSARQAHSPVLAGTIEAVLAETGLDPRLLTLEITESELLTTDRRSLAMLRAIKASGVSIALDDFGTGYSNLAYLRSLPVDAVKIDSTFVSGLKSVEAPDPVGERIVGALVSLAHALDLTVTVEGVETRTQAVRLRRLGCDHGQGWFFSEPGPAERIDALLRAYGGRGGAPLVYSSHVADPDDGE